MNVSYRCQNPPRKTTTIHSTPFISYLSLSTQLVFPFHNHFLKHAVFSLSSLSLSIFPRCNNNTPAVIGIEAAVSE
ncbi:hypothetical protein VNO80_03458 [Phaseolus coccineus]|uniref:Uncharacterized protein n=1 Tax=Phaseolus coccineus TaxID=3886 RepID=A0AAN9NW40_PHACN